MTIDLLTVTANHYFPFLRDWIQNLADPRNGESRTYSTEHLIYLGLVLFLCQAGSRRKLRKKKEGRMFLSNFLLLTGSAEPQTADTDTMNYLLERLPPEALETITWQLIRVLVRHKVLDRYRLNGEFLIAVDGTQLFATKKRHCANCLTKEHQNGTVTYFHCVLEAKLVTRTGFAFSFSTVSIENPDGQFDKQDCELKAFYRLAEIIKERFPRLRLCLLMDSLFAKEPVIDLCEKNRWGYFIVFKEGSLPNAYKQAMEKISRHPENSYERMTKDNCTQHFRWVWNIEHMGHRFHAIFCNETNHETGEENFYAFITDSRPDKNNIFALMNYGGRMRWKIENEGFNVQKNSGYKLGHSYGRQGHAWKNYYFLLQIAHLWTQLMEHGDLYPKLQKMEIKKRLGESGAAASLTMLLGSALSFSEEFGSILNFAETLMESFRMETFSDFALDRNFARGIQIRLDTS